MLTAIGYMLMTMTLYFTGNNRNHARFNITFNSGSALESLLYVWIDFAPKHVTAEMFCKDP